MNRLSQGST
jgi:hypothetical protein